jgi:cytochrome c oxidase subunit 3
MSEMAIEMKQEKMDPRKFTVWLLIVASIMLFAGLTSGFIVRHAEGNWDVFDLPPQFLYSLIAVLVSSLTMIFAFKSAQRDELRKTTLGLALTMLLAISFVYLQYLGWKDLAARGIFFSPEVGAEKGSISGSFVILLAAVHVAHAIGGLIFVTVVFVKSLFSKVHKKNLLSIDLCNTYWHFVGLLWVYLYLFLYFAPQF